MTAKAVLDEAREELESATERHSDAAEGWRELGVVLEYALALLGLGRCHFRLGRFADSAAPLREARQLLAGLGAGPLVAETDALLEQGATAAS